MLGRCLQSRNCPEHAGYMRTRGVSKLGAFPSSRDRWLHYYDWACCWTGAIVGTALLMRFTLLPSIEEQVSNRHHTLTGTNKLAALHVETEDQWALLHPMHVWNIRPAVRQRDVQNPLRCDLISGIMHCIAGPRLQNRSETSIELLAARNPCHESIVSFSVPHKNVSQMQVSR